MDVETAPRSDLVSRTEGATFLERLPLRGVRSEYDGVVVSLLEWRWKRFLRHSAPFPIDWVEGGIFPRARHPIRKIHSLPLPPAAQLVRRFLRLPVYWCRSLICLCSFSGIKSFLMARSAPVRFKHLLMISLGVATL